MTTLVTGGAGLLGAAVVHRLVDQGDKVCVIDLVENPARLSAIAGDIDYVQGDIADKALMEATIERVKPDAIYHLGAMLGAACEENIDGAMQANVIAVHALLELARAHGVRQFNFASSVTTMALDMPDRIMTDVTLQRPVSIYGVCKLFAEGMGRMYKLKYGLDFRSIRYPSIVGPGGRVGAKFTYTSDMISASMAGEPYTVAFTPETTVSLLYIDDAARAIVELAAAPAASIRTINYIIDGVQPQLSARELAERVKVKLPAAKIDFAPDPEFQPIADLMMVPLDDSCAKEEWGWQPRFDYDMIIDAFMQQEA